MNNQHLGRRQLRRAARARQQSLAREARKAALRAGLDYRVSGESGALVLHTHSLTWHRALSPNITAPPEGQAWHRSGAVKKVSSAEAPENRQVALETNQPASTTNPIE